MKWWREFWRLRKQSDRVKVMFLFFLAGIFFLADAIHGGTEVYSMVKSPAEYVVKNSAADELTSYQMNGIESIPDTGAISRQRTSQLALKAPEGEMTVECLELSEDYLIFAYGVPEESAMKTIYLNETAGEQLLQAFQKTEIEENYQTEYILGEQEETGMAKIRVLSEKLPNDTPLAFCASDSVRLSEGGGPVRVLMKRKDLDGMNDKRLATLGLQVVNAVDMEKTAMQQEMKFMQIKYDIIALALCMGALLSLKKFTLSRGA